MLNSDHFPCAKLLLILLMVIHCLTRCTQTLSSWFQTSTVLPAVSRSDHETVCLQPTVNPPCPVKSVKVIYRQLVSPNCKALLYNHLTCHNWTPLFQMNSCQQMVNSFYSDMSFCLDHFIPVSRTTVDNVNKPWVTKAFQDFIKQ